MNGAVEWAMDRPDLFRRLLERVLPWFNRDEYEREQAAIAHNLELSRRAVTETHRTILEARGVSGDVARRYERFDRVIRR